MSQRRNLITDVPGVLVGNADDARLASGVTAVVFEAPAVASIDVRGGGPGTRETALLDPAQTVQGIDAIALAGGSAFGLDAASGVQAWLAEQGRGFAVRRGAGADRARRHPVRPAQRRRQGAGADFRPTASWATRRPRARAATSPSAASGPGSGPRPSTSRAASARPPTTCGAFTVGALAAVNAAGSVVVGGGPWFWAAPFEQEAEFGGLRLSRRRCRRAPWIPPPRAARRPARRSPWWPPTPPSPRPRPSDWP